MRGDLPPAFDEDSGSASKVEPEDHDLLSHVKLRKHRKFDIDRRLRFLEKYRETGYIELSAFYAGVGKHTVNNFRKLAEPPTCDPEAIEFCDAFKLAGQLHGQEIVSTIMNQALHGHREPKFDKEGKKVGETIKFETALRKMAVQRHDKAYKDTQEVTHKSETGVMVVPTPVASVGAWAELMKNAKAERAEREAAAGAEKDDDK